MHDYSTCVYGANKIKNIQPFLAIKKAKVREKRTRTTNQLKSEHALLPKGNQMEYGVEQFCNWTCFPLVRSHIKANIINQPAEKKNVPQCHKKKLPIGLCSPNDWSKQQAVLFMHHDHGVRATQLHSIAAPIMSRVDH